jgi:hypothetical protein
MRAHRFTSGTLSALLLSLVLLPGAHTAFAQTKAAPPPSATAAMPSDEELATTREQVLTLLRMSPALTQVIEDDPTILADHDYVARVNPQLAQLSVLEHSRRAGPPRR